MALQLERQRERFETDPADRVAFEMLEEHYFLQGAWGELVALYERRLAAAPVAANPGESARLLFRLGQVLEERCQNPERAAERYQEATRLDPAFRPPIHQLRRMHAARGQWEVALQLAELEGRTPMRPYERADFLVELGTLWLTKMGDADQAMAHLQQALEAVPDHLEGLTGVARALEAAGRPAQASQAWEQALERLRGPDRAPALVALARLHASGPDPERAVALHRQALGHDPRYRPALDALAEVAAADEHWEELAELQERRFQLSAGARLRAAIALDAGRLHLEHLGDPVAARRWLGRARELCPDDPSVYLALAETERLAGDAEARARHLEQALELARDSASPDLLAEAAQVAAERGAPEQAVSRLRAAYEQRPEDPQLLEPLLDALARAGRDDELVDLLERHAEDAHSAPAQRAVLLARLGAVQEERIGDLAAARESYERALAADPARSETIASLERVLRKLEDAAGLRRLYEQAGEFGPADERPSWLCAAGELAFERGDTNAACRCFERALELEAGSARALAGLTRVATQTGDVDALLRSYERQAAVADDPARLGNLVTEIVRMRRERGDLAPALGGAERWASLAPGDRRALETLAEIQEAVEDSEGLAATLAQLDPLLAGGERAANRRRLAFLHAHEGREQESIEAWRAALESDPQDLVALEALRDAFGRAGRHAELAEVQGRLAALLPPTQRAAAERERATLLAERLGDLDGAIAALRPVVRSGTGSAGAEDQLEELLRRAGRFTELAEQLAERRARAQAGSPEARAFELRRAQVLLDPLARHDEAAEAFRSVLADDPDSAPAREGLEQALRAGGNDAGLAELLAEQAERTPDPEARARISLERAILLDERLERPDEAQRIYAALARGPRDSPAVAESAQRLERLLERSGDHAGLCEWLEANIVNAPLAKRAGLHARAARIARDRLSDRARALYHLEAAVALEPGVAQHWRMLAGLHDEMGRRDELVRALEGELSTPLESEREISVRARLAQLLADAPDDGAHAAEHCRRILELDPSHVEASNLLLVRLEREQRFEEMAPLLEARLAALEAHPPEVQAHEAERRSTLRLRLAALHAQHLDDVEGAIGLLEQALDEMGPIPAVTEPLADLLRRSGRPQALAHLCEEAAGASTLPLERADWLLRLGDARRELGEDAYAAEAYRGVLVERPGDRAARTALRELYARLGEHEALARLLESELRSIAGPGEIPLRRELADLLEGPLARPADALVHLRRLLELVPDDHDVLERAVRLAEQDGRADDAVALLDRTLEAGVSPGRQAALWARRAALLAGPLGRPEEAIDGYHRALERDPRRRDARRAVRELLESSGRWPEALDWLRREADEANDEERAELLERGARLAAEHVSPQAALAWYESLRALRPEDPEVALRVARIHELEGRSDAQERALEQACHRLPAGERRVALIRERARLLETTLDAPARAIAALEEARRIDPRHPDVLRDLERLLGARGRVHEQARILEARLQGPRDAEWREARRKLAALYADHLDEPERAAGALWEALAEERAPATRIDLLRRLGDALRATGRLEAWARVAAQELAELAPDEAVFRERRMALRLDLARVHGERLGRPSAAVEHLRALLDEEEDGEEGAAFARREEAQQALIRLLRAEGNHVELARRLAERLVLEPEDPDGWLELGRLREEQLWAPAAAADAYREVLRSRPGCRETLRALRRCCQRTGDWSEVARNLEAELADGDALPLHERAALWRRLGQVYAERLGDSTRASRAFAAALEADPRDRAALRSLGALFVAMEDWRGALDLYRSELDLLGDDEPERRQEVWLCIAELTRDRLGDLDESARAFASAALIGTLACPARAAWAAVLREQGQLERYAEVFASWCDDPSAQATAADHVQLARTLGGLGRDAEAYARLERAVECDPGCAEAWRGLAEAREREGDDGAARAWQRCGELTSGAEAAACFVRAARAREAEEPQEAATLLGLALAAHPTDVEAHALLACLAERLGRDHEAETCADRALEGVAGGAELAPERHAAVALAAARAAWRRGRPQETERFASLALDVDPHHAEALALRGAARVELGEASGARNDLEARLAQPDAGDRPQHLVLLARALEAEQAWDDALARFDEALALDDGVDAAHEGRARVLEQLGRRRESAAALVAWARCAGDPGARADRLTRAATLEESAPDALRLLRDATRADPSRAPAWHQLVERLSQEQRSAEVIEATARIPCELADAQVRARLAELRGRALEQEARPREAAAAFQQAAQADPHAASAVLAAARLLRSLGEWRAAAETLAGFAARRPADRDCGDAARVLLQLGRLRAGPLEDLEGAIAAYRDALAIDPGLREAREALAELLVHRPELRDEAVQRHLELIDQDPTRTASVRALVRLTRARGDSNGALAGLSILRALGVASREERSQAPARLPFPVAASPALADPVWECLRLAAHEASSALADALGASRRPVASPGQDPVSRFRNALLAAQTELLAPGLIPLPERELAETLRLLANLVLRPDAVRGDGHLVNALSGALGRRLRRRLRRILEPVPPEQIEAVDFAAWRAELRALATAVALDRSGGDLRSALLALVAEDGARELGGLPPEADLTPWVAASPDARGLLARTLEAWSRRVVPARGGGRARG